MPSVGIFLNQHLPLSEVFIANQARALSRYTPHLIACRQVTPSVTHQIPTYVLNKNGSLKEKFQEGLFKATGFSPEFKEEFLKHDLIHAHFGPTGWMASRLRMPIRRPLIVTCHGFDVTKESISIKNDGLTFIMYHAARKQLAQRTEKFICVSEYLKKKAIAFGFPEEKCEVIYMGIPLIEHTTPKQNHRDRSQPFRILSVGRLVPVKGHSKLIEAVSAVEQQGYNVHLDIVGNGPLLNQLEQQAQKSLKSYKFWGALPHSDIAHIMRQSDVFCHSSIKIENGQAEAFGLVISEAQWAGLPVIAFQSGGVSEAIKDRETGILCPEGDIREMKNAIIHLIENYDQRERMSRSAQEFIKINFDNKKQIQKVEALYDRVRGI